MSALSTHVLDTARGTPAEGIGIELFSIAGAPPERTSLSRMTTNADGRTDAPLERDLVAGTYELVFSVGAYFAARDTAAFYSEIAIRFAIDGISKYHVPLLLSPWGYSTYRGS